MMWQRKRNKTSGPAVQAEQRDLRFVIPTVIQRSAPVPRRGRRPRRPACRHFRTSHRNVQRPSPTVITAAISCIPSLPHWGRWCGAPDGGVRSTSPPTSHTRPHFTRSLSSRRGLRLPIPHRRAGTSFLRKPISPLPAETTWTQPPCPHATMKPQTKNPTENTAWKSLGQNRNPPVLS